MNFIYNLKTKFFALSCFLLMCCYISLAKSQEPVAIPLKLINGKLVLAADISSKATRKSFALLVDLDAPHSLSLHVKALGSLELAEADTKVELVMPAGLKASVARDDISVHPPSQAALLETMSKIYADEMDQRQFVGSIGIEFLKKYHVVLDANKKELVLSPPRPINPNTKKISSRFELFYHPLKIDEGQIWLSLDYAKGNKGYMVLSSTYYDTFIDASIAKKLSKPAGNVSPVWLSDDRGNNKVNLSEYVAFRPERLSAGGESKVLLMGGINLLENFRVEIDFVNRYMGLTQTKTPSYPAGDFAFFQARLNKDAEALDAWFEQYPANRLAREASELLLDWRMKKGASEEKMIRAARFYRDSAPELESARNCLAVLERFAAQKNRSLKVITAVGDLCLEATRKDADPLTLYKIHTALGRIRLEMDDITPAWKHFLSALFGQPDDGMLNLYLGRVYEKQERFRRAYSRYKHASLTHLSGVFPKEAREEAKAALVRLRDKLPKDDVLLLNQ